MKEELTPGEAETLRKMRAKWAIASYGSTPRKSDMPVADENADDNFLKGQEVAFTGEIPGLSRDEARKIVAERGGTPAVGVTKRTTMLVVGDWAEFSLRPGHGISLKYERAQKLQRGGQRIRIMDGLLFLEYLGRPGDVVDPVAAAGPGSRPPEPPSRPPVFHPERPLRIWLGPSAGRILGKLRRMRGR